MWPSASVETVPSANSMRLWVVSTAAVYSADRDSKGVEPSRTDRGQRRFHLRVIHEHNRRHLRTRSASTCTNGTSTNGTSSVPVQRNFGAAFAPRLPRWVESSTVDRPQEEYEGRIYRHRGRRGARGERACRPRPGRARRRRRRLERQAAEQADREADQI